MICIGHYGYESFFRAKNLNIIGEFLLFIESGGWEILHLKSDLVLEEQCGADPKGLLGAPYPA